MPEEYQRKIEKEENIPLMASTPFTPSFSVTYTLHSLPQP